MTDSNPNTGGPRGAAEGKRPWGTPRIIVSELADRTQIKSPTQTTTPVDRHVTPGSEHADPS